MSLLVVYSAARGKSLPRVRRWWVRTGGASPSGPNSAAVPSTGGPRRPPHPHSPHWGKKPEQNWDSVRAEICQVHKARRGEWEGGKRSPAASEVGSGLPREPPGRSAAVGGAAGPASALFISPAPGARRRQLRCEQRLETVLGRPGAAR